MIFAIAILYTRQLASNMLPVCKSADHPSYSFIFIFLGVPRLPRWVFFGFEQNDQSYRDRCGKPSRYPCFPKNRRSPVLPPSPPGMLLAVHRRPLSPGSGYTFARVWAHFQLPQKTFWDQTLPLGRMRSAAPIAKRFGKAAIFQSRYRVFLSGAIETERGSTKRYERCGWRWKFSCWSCTCQITAWDDHR